jgi:hypothetical protein
VKTFGNCIEERYPVCWEFSDLWVVHSCEDLREMENSLMVLLFDIVLSKLRE